MSYILDALKKAEHDRAIGQVPGIGSEHEPARRHVAGRWLWILLSVLLINVVLLAVLLWPHAESTPPSDTVEHTVDAPGRALPVPAAPAAVGSAEMHSSGLSAPHQPAIAETPTDSSPLPLRPLPPLPEPAQVDVVGTRKGAERDAGTAVTVVSPPLAQAPAPDVNNNLPVWPQISSQLLSELGTSLHLDVHVYSENIGERFVLINMRRYHQGGKLQEGPVVDEITPDSVILSFHGQRFRMQSQ